MIRISITSAASKAIAATLPLGHFVPSSVRPDSFLRIRAPNQRPTARQETPFADSRQIRERLEQGA